MIVKILIVIILFWGCSHSINKLSSRKIAEVRNIKISGCDNLMEAALDSETLFLRESIELKKKEIKKFTIKYNSYLNNREVILDYPYIGQDSKIYIRGQEFNIRFLGDKNKTQIYVFSSPVQVDGKEIVHIKIWNNNGNHVLEKIPLNELWKLAKESYIETLVKGNIVLLPINKREDRLSEIFASWRVIEKRGELVKLKSTSGKVKFVKARDVFSNNVGLKPAEKELINSFYNTGAEGEVLIYSKMDSKLGGTEGVYIKIDKIPFQDDFEMVKNLFVDIDSYNLIKRLIDKGESIYLTSSEKGFYGMWHGHESTFVHSINEIAKKRGIKNAIVVSNRADGSTVIHETYHLQDGKKKILKNLNEWIGKMKEKAGYSLGREEQKIIDDYIFEHRAYTGTINYLIQQGQNNKGLKRIFEGNHENRVSYNYFARERTLKLKHSFLITHYKKMEEVLLAITDKEFKEELLSRIRVLTPSGKNFSFDELSD